MVVYHISISKMKLFHCFLKRTKFYSNIPTSLPFHNSDMATQLEHNQGSNQNVNSLHQNPIKQADSTSRNSEMLYGLNWFHINKTALVFQDSTHKTNCMRLQVFMVMKIQVMSPINGVNPDDHIWI